MVDKMQHKNIGVLESHGKTIAEADRERVHLKATHNQGPYYPLREPREGTIQSETPEFTPDTRAVEDSVRIVQPNAVSKIHIAGICRR